MNRSEQTKKPAEGDAPPNQECQAEFIFYARTRSDETRPVKILGNYACDYRRPDWEHRWSEWRSRQNSFLNLFLCGDHARELGLLDETGRSTVRDNSPKA